MSYGYNSYGPPHGGQPGGFSQQGGPPPGADPQLWSWFQAVDTDRSGAITARELSQALVNGNWTPFDLDTVKLLMSIFDTDRSGTIGFREFEGVWKYIQDWQNVFKHFDRDNSGSIDRNELQAALAQFQFNLSPPLIDLILKKYVDVKGTDASHAGAGPRMGGMPMPGAGSAAATISFDRFLRACVVVKQISETFGRFDTNRSGWIQINYDQFMDAVLRLP